MTTYFISRHKGALNWLERQGIKVDCYCPHLDLQSVKKGDMVIGTLPVNLVAKLTSKGVRYLHLTLDLTLAQRGMELTAEQMDACHARLEEYQASKINPHKQTFGHENETTLRIE